MINKDGIKKWVEALRSGNYKQGSGTLKEIDKDGRYEFCCLGVISEIYSEKVEDLREEDTPKQFYDQTEADDVNTSVVDDYLPNAVMNWLGVTDNDVEVYVDQEKFDIVELGDEAHNIVYNEGKAYLRTTLARLNDRDVTFERIAAIIEDYFLNA